MNFDFINDTEININGQKYYIRMENGMTGIGSRAYWINGIKQSRNLLRQSGDLTKGNHFIYKIKWRDNPWDIADIIISEEQLPTLLDENNKWREPMKRETF